MADVRLAAAFLACLPLASCAALSSLSSYSKCEGACTDSDSATSLDISTTGDASASDDGGPGNPYDSAGNEVIAPGDAPTATDSSRDGAPSPPDGPTASDATDAIDGTDAADATDSGDATEASASCDGSTCPVTVSAASAWSCLKGACNATCSASSTCSCSSDTQCSSGKCVKTAGRNDQSCGSACTGSGPADGFGCELASPGIPATCATTFGYSPSNFAPSTLLGHAPASTTTIGCNLTYDSSSHAFTACSGSCTGNFCSGATAPYIAPGVAQTVSGGPSVDILVFSGLTLNAGSTLTIVNAASSGGGNAVILAVYGDTTIAGTIHADGSAGATGGAVNSNTPGTSGPGGNFGCTQSNSAGSGLNGGPSCSNPTNDCRDSGGGGGGGSAAGGAGAAGVSGNAGSAGAARANTTISPLRGGCAGGTSGGWACTTYGGGAGGAVQISAAGALSVSGTITANGGTGGSSNCSAAYSLCGVTYGGGGGGGGSGGAILLEGHTVSATGSTSANGGAGGASQGGGSGGAGGTSASLSGAGGNGSNGGVCGSASGAGGGGGGGYGYTHVNGSGSPAAYACVTPLSPAPVCGPGHAACLCADDSNCPSGKCINANQQCTGTCTGTGAADVTDCQPAVLQPTSYACSVGNCSNVSSATGTCNAAGLPCYCTRDAQCASGRCVAWAGCAAGACTGAGAADGFHCAM